MLRRFTCCALLTLACLLPSVLRADSGAPPAAAAVANPPATVVAAPPDLPGATVQARIEALIAEFNETRAKRDALNERLQQIQGAVREYETALGEQK